MGAILAYKLVRVLTWALCFSVLLTTPVVAQSSRPRPRADHKHYVQCLIKIGNPNNQLYYKDARGHLGLFQINLRHAHQAGLCSTPVPASSGQQNWALCDFKGPVAVQYGIKNESDLLFGKNAIQAQFALIGNLMKHYDAYIFEKKYDLLYGQMVGGILINQEIMRGLLLTYGTLITHEFVNNRNPVSSAGQTPYAIAACLEQCMISEGKQWYCDSLKPVTIPAP